MSLPALVLMSIPRAPFAPARKEWMLSRKDVSGDTRRGAISVSRPSLDDVFLHATGRRLEGEEQSAPTDDEEESR